MRYNTSKAIWKFFVFATTRNNFNSPSTGLVQRPKISVLFPFPLVFFFSLIVSNFSICLFISFWPAKKLCIAMMGVQARLFTDFVTS